MPLRTVSARTAGAVALVLFLTLAEPSQAQNLLINGTFDTDSFGWLFGENSALAVIGWSPEDASGDPASGSLELTSLSHDQETVRVAQCVPVVPGSRYRYGGKVYVAPHDAPIVATVGLTSYREPDCQRPYISRGGTGVRVQGQWVAVDSDEWIAASDVVSAEVRPFTRREADGTDPFVVRYDDVYLVRQDGGLPDEPPPGPDPDDPVPAPDPAGWFTDPAFPGFRFNVLINGQTNPRTGTREPSCLPETVCVSGAVPGRVEILMRIVGPKPNGYLWPTLFKASTSRFDVWIDQKGGPTRHYVLEAATPGSTELPGFFDREGFLP